MCLCGLDSVRSVLMERLRARDVLAFQGGIFELVKSFMAAAARDAEAVKRTLTTK